MRVLEYVILTAIGLGLAYFVATPVAKFVEQSFAEAARNLEQMK